MTDEPTSIGLGGLNPQEVATMELVIEGMPDRRVAERLGTTQGNVMLARASIYKKLNVQSRTQAIRAWQGLKSGGPLDLKVFSETEVAILEVMTEGLLTNKAIAEQIGVA